MYQNKVNISSQVVLMFIPIVDIFAFYRIKKLRKFALFAVIPVTLVGIIGSELIESENIEIDMINKDIENQEYFETQIGKISTSQYTPIIVGLEIGLIGLRVYLVIRWSNEWNKRIES